MLHSCEYIHFCDMWWHANCTNWELLVSVQFLCFQLSVIITLFNVDITCLCCVYDVLWCWQKAGADSGRVLHAETNLRYVMRGSCTGFNRYLRLALLSLLWSSRSKLLFIITYKLVYHVRVKSSYSMLVKSLTLVCTSLINLIHVDLRSVNVNCSCVVKSLYFMVRLFWNCYFECRSALW